MATQTYYKGANGQEYLTALDAETYGGGYIGARTVTDPIYTPATPEELAKIKANVPTLFNAPVAQVALEKAEPAASSIPLNSSFDGLSEEELRETAKTLSIKGYHLMGKSKLLEKIKLAMK